jgi:large subunit ribosomal protein L5
MLAQYYKTNVMKSLTDEFKYKSVMEVPRIQKITLNMGIGEAVADKKILDKAMGDMTKMSGQKPLTTYAKNSVATFKIREGWPIGCKVTLRRVRMYDFLKKLIDVVIPRVRDFRGMSKRSFDGRGNYSFGFREQIVFPEINYDEIDMLRGLDVTITTSARTDKEAYALLKAFHFPFKEDF